VIYYHATEYPETAERILSSGVLKPSRGLPGFYMTRNPDVLQDYGRFVVKVDSGGSRVYDLDNVRENFAALRVSLRKQYGDRVLDEPWRFHERWWTPAHYMSLSGLTGGGRGWSPIRAINNRNWAQGGKVSLWAIRKLAKFGFDGAGESKGDEGVVMWNTSKCKPVPPVLFREGTKLRPLEEKDRWVA